MDDQLVFESSIRKAITHGFDESVGESALQMLPAIFSGGKAERDLFIRGFITSHDFLKALFGEPKIAKIRGMRVIDAGGQTLSESHSFDEGNRGWQYHGPQLVLAQDYIDYLRKHV